MPERDSTPQQRAAVAVLLIARAGPVSTDEIARVTGLTIHGAWVLMARLSASHELQLYQTDEHQWALGQ